MLPPCGGRGRGGTELGASGGSGLGQQTAADGEGTAGAVECGGVPWMGAQGPAIKVCKCECVWGMREWEGV